MAGRRRPPQENRPPRARRPRSSDAPHPRKKSKIPPRRGGLGFSATVVVALFFGFAIVYMGIQAYRFFSPNVEIMTLRLGNMERQESVQGMIIRYEEVFRADRDGRVLFDVQDFDRVRSGMLVASIQDVDVVSRTEQDMALLQQEIIGVNEMRHAAQSDPAVERVNANLRSRMDRSMHHHMQMNLSEVYALLERLTQITDNRNRMIINESVHIRNDLNRQYDILNARRDMNLSDIYAESSGIMSPIIDGFENLFTPANMRELSREQVRMSIDHEAIIPGREVSAGDEVFKVVENTWYVAVWMPLEMAHGLTVGADRTVFLENTQTGRFEPMPMRIHYVNTQHLRDTFVIFRSTRNVIDFLHQRNVNVRITDSVQNGFMIPPSAIATRRFFRVPLAHIHGRDEYFVMHRRDDGIQPIPVHIYERTESYAYVLEDSFPLWPGDILVPADSDGIFHVISEADIRIVRGVYRTTLNFADFHVIHIDGEVTEGTHVLLDPARNPSIRQFDTIVIDAAMVRQNQIVR